MRSLLLYMILYMQFHYVCVRRAFKREADVMRDEELEQCAYAMRWEQTHLYLEIHTKIRDQMPICNIFRAQYKASQTVQRNLLSKSHNN